MYVGLFKNVIKSKGSESLSPKEIRMSVIDDKENEG